MLLDTCALLWLAEGGRHLSKDAKERIEAAPVERVVEELPPALVELALWIAAYYGSTPGRALALVAPLKRKARGVRPRPAERDALCRRMAELDAEYFAATSAGNRSFRPCAQRYSIATF